MEKLITNPFAQGDLVVCINDNFPWIPEYGGVADQAIAKPREHEQLTVSEVLGDFVRFDQYDTPESYNWWKHDRFVPVKQGNIVETFAVLGETIGKYWTQEALDEYFAPDPFDVD